MQSRSAKFPPPTNVALLGSRTMKRQSIGHHSALVVGANGLPGKNFSRSRSAPSNRGLTTGGSATASSNASSSSNTTRNARVRSMPSGGGLLNSNVFRSKSMGYPSSINRTATPRGQGTRTAAGLPVSQRVRETPRFTPTKVEIGKIRNELVGDKQHFVSQYPVAPSPVRFSVTPSPVKVGRQSYGKESSMGGSLTPQRGSSVMVSIEAELATLRSELEAEKSHSQAMSKQARDLALQVDREQREFKAEKTKLQMQIKKMEATTAQAITDREDLRKRTATEVSGLRKDLEKAERENRILKERIEILESIPPPPPAPSVLKSCSKVTWNPMIDYREQSPLADLGSSDEATDDTTEETDVSDVDPDLEHDLHEMYREYDTNGVGILTKLQVSAAYQCMERTFGLSEVPLSFPDHIDGIDFKEFVRIMSALPTRLANETTICNEEA